MAFYTSRVDDNGVEIERRLSARSVTIRSPGSSSHFNLSATNSDQTSSSVRYVNPAAYIEKTGELSDRSSVSLGTGTSDPNFTAPSEGRSDIVPPLDIQSEENYATTTRDYTFSYRKHCEAAKLVLKPDLAYETWLSAKRKTLSDEAQRRKKAEELKRKEQEQRKRMSEEKFQEWLDAKARSVKENRDKGKQQEEPEEKPRKPQKIEISEAEVRARREEWERKKKIEDEQRRILKQQEEEQRREVEDQRKQQAADAWEKWIADAAKKPKPVPLNRGIFTLRGTVSEIFVNPNEWQTVLPGSGNNNNGNNQRND